LIYLKIIYFYLRHKEQVKQVFISPPVCLLARGRIHAVRPEGPQTTRKFSGFLKDRAGAYGLKADNHIKNGSGQNNRGYIGVKVA